jgi:hypothetical protein
MTDAQLEAAMLSGAVTALRRRAERQREIAAAHGEGSGEAAIADRIAEVLAQLADEFERDALALAEGSAP